jgi:hypothetical protein
MLTLSELMFNELSNNNNSLIYDRSKKTWFVIITVIPQFSLLLFFLLSFLLAPYLFIGIERPTDDTFKHLNSCIIVKLFYGLPWKAWA